jgi:penicillin amidase/acyl-homoserine-lactone acylase
MRIALTTIGSLLGIVLLTAVGVVLLRAEADAPPPVDTAPLIAQAGKYEVKIHRDHFGIPHIYGETDSDVAFGLAFAHAEDDFATIQEVAIAARGQLAAIKGIDAAVTDYLVHLLRVWDAVDAKYYTHVSPEARALAEAYADGVNYYAALNPDEVEAGLLPMTGKDVVAGFTFKAPFFYGMQNHILELFEPERKREMSMGPENAFLLTDEAFAHAGSNGFAVAPSRSADGKTRLLVNSHQPYKGPVAWYEARLKSEEGWDAVGGVFPGSPLMLHGHNRRVGWASTVNKPDLVDTYVLTVNPDNPDQYLLDGEWRQFEKTSVDIKVKLWGPFWWTVSRDVEYSEHGPVIRQEHGTYAVRYAGMGEVGNLDQRLAMNKAGSLEEWLAAMAMQALPSINYIYADADGNIALLYNGQMPKRVEGFDWQEYLPGDRSDLIWKEYLPFEYVPLLLNPKAGFITEANSTPYRATAPEDDLKPEDFSATLGIETQMTNRAFRALELLGSDASITAEEFRAYKYDHTYSAESELASLIADVLAVDAGSDEDLKQAQNILRDWDLRTDYESRGAALGVLMGEPVVRARLGGKEPPAPLDSLQEAIAHLKEHFGRLDPRWGEVNRIIRGSVDMPIQGGPDILRAVYGRKGDKDGRLSAEGGDTYIMFVEWDKDGAVTSESIHQFGSATIDETSSHFADQAPLFAEEKTTPVLLDWDAFEPTIAESYRPGRRAAR